MSMITEIVNMKTIDGVPKEEFIEIIDELETNFHFKQPGYIDSEILYDENQDMWIMIMHWSSIDALKSASSNMFKDSATEKFRAALDPKAVNISVFPTLRSWSLQSLQKADYSQTTLKASCEGEFKGREIM